MIIVIYFSFVDSIRATLGEEAAPAVAISLNISSRGKSVRDTAWERGENKDWNL